MFKNELKGFKIKKNATAEELQLVLQEMETLVNCQGINEFITDSILNIIKMGENISSYSKYDISGYSDMLQSNSHFLKLCQMLYIKYKVFASVPPEFHICSHFGSHNFCY